MALTTHTVNGNSAVRRSSHELARIAWKDQNDWVAWKQAFLLHFDQELTFDQFNAKLSAHVQQDHESIMAYVQAKQQIYSNSRDGWNLLVMDQVDDIRIDLRNEATKTALWTHYDTMDVFLQRARAHKWYDETEGRRIKEKAKWVSNNQSNECKGKSKA